MKKGVIIFILIAVLVLGSAVALAFMPSKPGQLDSFASCVKDSGATFYGAFWCPHCHEQKSLFGRSAKLLPYQECSTPDGKGQNDLCDSKDIKSYPTWEFKDGSRNLGTMTLEALASSTACVLPSS
jgi:thiol-disulfide isomerase/thioredoxin